MTRAGRRRRARAPDDPEMPTRPLLDFQSGYVQRALDRFPRQGEHGPWHLAMSYDKDVKRLRHGPRRRRRPAPLLRAPAAAARRRASCRGMSRSPARSAWSPAPARASAGRWPASSPRGAHARHVRRQRGRAAEADRAPAATEVHEQLLDVSDRDAFEAYADAVAGHFGVVHQIYNNAGIALSATVLESSRRTTSASSA